MAEKLFEPRRPHGLWRWLARLPIWLYRAGLGWLLGQRFLLLTHRGRRSGLPRRSVLEVVKQDPVIGAYYVASGWGEKADWYRNVMADPQVEVQVAGRRFRATARRLATEQAEGVLLDYARRHPLALKELARILGYRLDGTPTGVRALAQHLPLVELRPA